MKFPDPVIDNPSPPFIVILFTFSLGHSRTISSSRTYFPESVISDSSSVKAHNQQSVYLLMVVLNLRTSMTRFLFPDCML